MALVDYGFESRYLRVYLPVVKTADGQLDSLRVSVPFCYFYSTEYYVCLGQIYI